LGLFPGSGCPDFVEGIALAAFGPLKVKPFFGFLGFLGGTVDKAYFTSFKLKQLK
jgi:hypothetical protein